MSNIPDVMLAESWTEEIDPTGYWMSEKLDGVRAYWDGHNFYSRQKIRYHAPKSFRQDLPNTPLDGELWCGRGQFQRCVSIVKKKDANVNEEEWKYVTYLVFDAPSHKGLYEDRVKYLHSVIDSTKYVHTVDKGWITITTTLTLLRDTSYAAVVGIKKCKNKEHLDATLKSVLDLGGEGVMLRLARSKYENKRSNNLLKVKNFFDEEAKVIGYRIGTGRLTGLMGAVEPNGQQFHIGTGFSDNQRKDKNKPKIGQVVTFKYQELSNNGHPRFPVFLRVREDITWKDVVKNYKENPPFSATKKIVPVLKKDHSLLFSTVPSRDEAGNKVVRDEDVEDDEEEQKDSITTPATKQQQKIPCQYGDKCYRNNKEHLDKYSHPPKDPNKQKQLKKEKKGEGKDTANDSDRDGDMAIGRGSSESEDTLPLPLAKLTAGSDAEATEPIDLAKLTAIANRDSDSESESDNSQALISVREWRRALQRISRLEAKVAELQQQQHHSKKRPRDDDYGTDVGSIGGKNKKARHKL